MSVREESFQVLEETVQQHTLCPMSSQGIQAECTGSTDGLAYAHLLLAEGSISRWTQQQQQHPRCFLDMHNAAAKSVFLATLWLSLLSSRCLLNALAAHHTFSLYRSVCNSSNSSMVQTAKQELMLSIPGLFSDKTVAWKARAVAVVGEFQEDRCRGLVDLMSSFEFCSRSCPSWFRSRW